MGVNLQKGQKVDLTKGNEGLSKIMIGLGWDPVVSSGGGGFFSSLFGQKAHEIDCDASVLMLDSNNKLGSIENTIYFGNLKSKCGSVQHMGDNLTGGGDGDDEQIIVELTKIPAHIHKMVFVVNIYDCINRKQDFGHIENAFIRVVNRGNNAEIMKYNLTESYTGKTALIAGEIYRHDGGWKFGAIGEGTSDGSLRAITERYF